MTEPDNDTAAALRKEFATNLAPTCTSKWGEAFASVPRHAFVPAFYTQGSDGAWERVGPADPGYLEAVYSDRALTTQLDERGIPTSSSSEPSVMLTMLDALDAAEGDTVFELGTGTGYNAALLSHRLGEQNVTTIDVDPDLTEAAAQRLANVGLHPFVATGDGAGGRPDRAPYQRLIATAALRSIPDAFFRQAAPGAVIVAPVGYGILRVTVTDPGYGTGYFLPTPAYFMPRRTPSAPPAFAEAETAEPTTTTTAPSDILGRIRFPLALALPGHTTCSWRDDDGDVTAVGIWTEDGSTATAHVSGKVRQVGPRRLWDVVESLAETFPGEPERQEFRVSITPGRQTVWYRTQDGPAWDLPQPR
ncbi:methyltransferase domain-containing protein [Streptomyces griseoaurantiacus]|uniref:methyltransferase domain-containing protein n=1 Tax=Streptomyces griseoaurantiacus TaxID=68213 RepID=UPI00345F671A